MRILADSRWKHTERHKQILLAVSIAALVWIVLFAIYRVAVMQPIWN